MQRLQLPLAGFAAFVAASCARVNHPQSSTPAVPATAATQQVAPPVTILIADVDRSIGENGHPKNTFTTLHSSDLTFKKAFIEAQADSDFSAEVITDRFPAKIGASLVVKVNDRVFVPNSYSGDRDAYWSLGLTHIDRATAETLNGGPLPRGPADSLTVSYLPQREPYPLNGPVPVGLWVNNIGKGTLTYFWGTTGGGNAPCRDTQLSFTATLNGNPVSGNPHPLPNGYISSPFTAEPHHQLKRSVDLSEWIAFGKPGKYVIDATYTVTIQNPTENASPRTWPATYRDQFIVQVGDK